MDHGQMNHEGSEKEQGRIRKISSQAVKEFLGVDIYNRPVECKECGGIMIYKGVGEYKCEDCGALEYDDYGKARNYLEGHRGATAAEVSEATGVSQKKIRTMLKESKLEVAANSREFLRCEMCGENIRSGRFCPKCEAIYHRNVEAEARANRKSVTGYGAEQTAEEGAKRFRRDKG